MILLQWNDQCEEVFESVKEVLRALPAMQALDWDKVFYVNLSMGKDAIGAMLLQKGIENQYMKPIFCASRVKTMDFLEIELIMVSVVFACWRFCHYL